MTRMRPLHGMLQIAAVVAAIAVTAGAAAASSVGAPAYAEILDNGLKVIVQEDHSTDLVAVDVWVRTGAVNEADETSGVSHLIEHLMFRSTESRGPGQVDMEIETLGASAEAKTSRDWTHFYTVVARRYLGKALDILSDVVLHPRFRQEDIDQERQVIIDEIARRDSDPLSSLQVEVFRAAYTVHAYRLPIEGSRESVAKMTREVIADYYNRFYVPANMSVVLVGDITAADGVTAVRKVFGNAKKKPAPDRKIVVEPERTAQVRENIKRSTRLAYLAIAFPAPSVKDRPDVYAMDVLMSYLGMGYQSWLSTELQDAQRLVVQASSDFLTQRDPGLAILTAAAELAKLQKVEDAIFAKVSDLRSTRIGEADLARAKRSLEGGYAFDMETFSGRATTLGFYETTDSFEFARSYVQNIRRVTADDVLALAKTYLDPDRAVVVTLGP